MDRYSDTKDRALCADNEAADHVLRLDTVILNTLLWMSGLGGDTADGEAAGQRMAQLSALLNDIEKTSVEEHPSLSPPLASPFTNQPTKRSQTASPLSDLAHFADEVKDSDTLLETQKEKDQLAEQSLFTPPQRRIPALHTHLHGVSDVVNRENEAVYLSDIPSGPAGLVSTAHTTPTMNSTAAADPSQAARSREFVRSENDLSTTPPQQHSSLNSANKALSMNCLMPPRAVSDSMQWQHDFALHAQQLLRETHKQVGVLREYQATAARERQRAEQLMEAQRVLQEQLAAEAQKRQRDVVAHTATVSELSRQVLELDATVSELRRKNADLQNEMEAAQSAVMTQRREMEEVKRSLTAHYEARLDALVQERAAYEEAWKQEREVLQRAAVLDGAATAFEQQPPNGEGRLQVHVRVEAATNTDRNEPSTNSADSSDVETAIPQHALKESAESEAQYTRVHPDVLVQQELREQTLMSQLSLLEARLQREGTQRRQAQQQVADLLRENEALREDAMTRTPPSPPSSSAAAVDAATASPEAAVQAPKLSSTEEQPIQGEDTLRQQQSALREVQDAYEALQKESMTLLHRYTSQQRQHAQQWSTVRTRLTTLFAFANADARVLEDNADDAQNSSVVVKALEELLVHLQKQKETEAVVAAQDREAIRLAAMHEALQQSEQQNNAHQATLEEVEAQLRCARDELAEWQQRQDALLRRQREHDAAWQSALKQYRGVAAILRRAMRIYAPPLPEIEKKKPAVLHFSKRNRGARSVSELSTKDIACAATSKAHVATSGSSSRNDIAASESDSDTKNNNNNASGASMEVEALPVEDDVPAARANNADASEADDTMDGVDVSPISAATDSQNTPSSISQSGLRTVDDEGVLNMQHSMHNLRREVQVLLKAWRARQRALVEAQEQWKRQASDAAAACAELQAKHRLQKRDFTQQLRQLRTTEEERVAELEGLKREWTAMQREQAARHEREVQSCRADAVRERDVLVRRLQLEEEAKHRATEELAKTQEENAMLTETVERLQEAHNDDVAAQGLAQRRQVELNTHIEDLEARLQDAQHTTRGLHTLLTVSVRAIVLLMLNVHQLRHQCFAAHALRCDAELNLRVTEVGIAALHRQLNQNEDTPASKTTTRAAQVAELQKLILFTPVASGSLVLSPTVTRLRVVACAVLAAIRLSKLAKRSKDAVLTTPSNSSSTATTWQPVLDVLALHGVHDSLHVLDISSTDKHRSALILPEVQLPAAHELVASLLRSPLHNARTNEQNSLRAQESKPFKASYIDDDQDRDTVDCANSSSTTTSATPQLLLKHLLSVAQVDVRAARTREAFESVAAAKRWTPHFHHAAQLALQRCARLSRLKQEFESRSDSGLGLLPSLSALLSPPLLTLQPLLQWWSWSTLQSQQLHEVQSIVQKLVAQNQRLVTAVETQAQLDETRLVEMDALTADAARCAPQQAALLSLQEKLVQSHASLLEERQLRRTAEAQLAVLHQQQLQWMGREEDLRREVYVLNMELANRGTKTSTSAALLPPPPPSVLSLEHNSSAVAMSEETSAAVRSAALASEAVKDSGIQRYSDNPLYTKHVQVEDAKTRLADEEKDREYYGRLLRGAASADPRGKQRKSPLRYEARRNIPSMEELTQLLRASSSKACTSSVHPNGIEEGRFAPATLAASPVQTQDIREGLQLYVPKVVQEREQQQWLQRSLNTRTEVHGDAKGKSEAYNNNNTNNEFSQRGAGVQSGASNDTTFRVVISPSRKHPQRQSTHTPRQQQKRETVDQLNYTLQHPTPPSIHTGTALSTPPSRHPSHTSAPHLPHHPQHQQSTGSSKGAAPTNSFTVSHARQNAAAAPQHPPPTQDANAITDVEQVASAAVHQTSSEALARAWAPSSEQIDILTPVLHSERYSDSRDAPRSAAAASAESHLARWVGGRAGSERSTTQPPPAVRLSISVPLLSSSSSSFTDSSEASAALSSRQSASGGASEQRGVADETVSLASGPMYFKKRAA